MERIPNTFKDVDLYRALEHIFQNALGNPLVLDSVPANKEDMKANTAGVSGNDLFMKFGNGELKKYPGLPFDSTKAPVYTGDSIPGLNISGNIPGNATGIVGAVPFPDGTYVIGQKLTGGGNDGKITVTNGIITSVQEAT